MKTIYEFKKGVEIVRVQPAKSLGPMISLSGAVIDGGGDRSYIGEKMTFIGIANGCIYYKREDKFLGDEDANKIKFLSLDCWSEGWELYINPNSLLEGTANNSSEIDNLAKEAIEQRLQKAVADEDYELAEKLKTKLQTFKK